MLILAMPDLQALVWRDLLLLHRTSYHHSTRMIRVLCAVYWYSAPYVVPGIPDQHQPKLLHCIALVASNEFV